jgi:hypothetical protein
MLKKYKSWNQSWNTSDISTMNSRMWWPDNDENLNEGTESDEGDEDIEEIDHLFDLAEKDVDEFCDICRFKTGNLFGLFLVIAHAQKI